MPIKVRRVSVGVVLSGLSASLVAASLAWACSPTNWGWTPPTAPTPGQGAQPSSAPAPAPQPQHVGSPQSSQTVPPRTSVPSSAIAAQRTSGASQRTSAHSGTQTAPTASRHAASSQPSTSLGGQRASGPASAPGGFASTRSASTPGGTHVAAAQSRVSSPRSPAPRVSAAHRGIGPLAARPEQQGGTGDLWSAYGSANKTPSLTPSTSGPSSSSGGAAPGGQLPVGVVLLALGAAGLLGGLAIGGARRRRALTRIRAVR